MDVNGLWRCPVCTFAENESSLQACAVCDAPRQSQTSGSDDRLANGRGDDSSGSDGVGSGDGFTFSRGVVGEDGRATHARYGMQVRDMNGATWDFAASGGKLKYNVGGERRPSVTNVHVDHKKRVVTFLPPFPNLRRAIAVDDERRLEEFELMCASAGIPSATCIIEGATGNNLLFYVDAEFSGSMRYTENGEDRPPVTAMAFERHKPIKRKGAYIAAAYSATMLPWDRDVRREIQFQTEAAMYQVMEVAKQCRVAKAVQIRVKKKRWVFYVHDQMMRIIGDGVLEKLPITEVWMKSNDVNARFALGGGKKMKFKFPDIASADAFRRLWTTRNDVPDDAPLEAFEALSVSQSSSQAESSTGSAYGLSSQLSGLGSFEADSDMPLEPPLNEVSGVRQGVHDVDGSRSWLDESVDVVDIPVRRAFATAPNARSDGRGRGLSSLGLGGGNEEVTPRGGTRMIRDTHTGVALPFDVDDHNDIIVQSTPATLLAEPPRPSPAAGQGGATTQGRRDSVDSLEDLRSAVSSPHDVANLVDVNDADAARTLSESQAGGGGGPRAVRTGGADSTARGVGNASSVTSRRVGDVRSTETTLDSWHTAGGSRFVTHADARQDLPVSGSTPTGSISTGKGHDDDGERIIKNGAAVERGQGKLTYGKGGGHGKLRRQMSEGDDNLCVICLDAEKTHAAVPCGHMALCKTCARGTIERCPICRTLCDTFMQIYQ